MNRVLWAVLATLFFSLSTPFTKELASGLPPIFLAATLYAGSILGVLVGFVPGLGLSPGRLGAFFETGILTKTSRRALLASILIGGVIAPVLLVFGLSRAKASDGSLLMNSEGIFTVLVAWIFLRERMTAKLLAGTLLGGAGCALLSWEGKGGSGFWYLPFLFAALFWAIDSNILRFLGEVNPLVLTFWKGLGSSLLLFALSLSLEHSPRPSMALVEALGVGGIGYGVSLVFFIRSIRTIGVSRTGAWFSFSPFMGALFSIWLLGDRTPRIFFLSFAILVVAAVLLQEEGRRDREAERS